MSFCILIRNPRSDRVQMIVNSEVIDIFDEKERVALYDTEEAAEADEQNIACIKAGWPYRVVETP